MEKLLSGRNDQKQKIAKKGIDKVRRRKVTTESRGLFPSVLFTVTELPLRKHAMHPWQTSASVFINEGTEDIAIHLHYSWGSLRGLNTYLKTLKEQQAKCRILQKINSISHFKRPFTTEVFKISVEDRFSFFYPLGRLCCKFSQSIGIYCSFHLKSL